MKTSFKMEEPESAQMTMTITMPLHQWAKLSTQLQDAYPSWELSSNINSMVYQAQKEFCPLASTAGAPE